MVPNIYNQFAVGGVVIVVEAIIPAATAAQSDSIRDPTETIINNKDKYTNKIVSLQLEFHALMSTNLVATYVEARNYELGKELTLK